MNSNIIDKVDTHDNSDKLDPRVDPSIIDETVVADGNTCGDTLKYFHQEKKKIKSPRTLELGTRRVEGDPPTTRQDWVPHASEYICSDFQEGLDVDVVADIHTLSETFGCESFDIIICLSTFEHIQRPWIAAPEIAKVIKPGGLFYCHTHQTYPLHGHPHDYWRFSREALETLFCKENGFDWVETDYEFPCDIVSDENENAKLHPSYLNVRAFAKKY